jgi:hypothetical protein
MSEQPAESEGLTDDAISPDSSTHLRTDVDERTDPDLANGVPPDEADGDSETDGDTE